MKRVLQTLFFGLLVIASQGFAANDSNNPQVTVAEKAKIEKVVHDYLINKPEVIIQAMQVLQKKQYEEAKETMKGTEKMANRFAKDLFKKPNDPAAGNANGTIEIAEFFDYQCPHCTDMAPVIQNILKDNPNVRVVFKEFPIRGPLSTKAAMGALAANKQGKYYEFSHALLTANQTLSENLVLEIAQKQGLNMDQFKKDLNDKNLENQLNENIKLAQQLKLLGTPAFFIMSGNNKNNKIAYVPGQINQKELQDMINKFNK